MLKIKTSFALPISIIKREMLLYFYGVRNLCQMNKIIYVVLNIYYSQLSSCFITIYFSVIQLVFLVAVPATTITWNNFFFFMV